MNIKLDLGSRVDLEIGLGEFSNVDLDLCTLYVLVQSSNFDEPCQYAMRR